MELTTHTDSPSASRTLAIVPQPRGLRRLLRVPLLAKLAGANLLVVVATWAAVYAMSRTLAGEWRMIAVITVVLAVGLVVNLSLVAIALRPIRDLERTAMRVWGGDLDTRVPLSAVADADLDQVAGTLNFLLSALARDRARVRMLASEVVRTSDRERARVGRELHDSVAQAIAALRYQLIAIEREAANTELADRLEALRLSAGALLEQVRLLSHTVHPQILDDLGLVPALRHLVRTASVRVPASLTVTSGADAEFRAISTDAAAALYWIAQEAIGNANLHASPKSIEVRVGLADGAVVMHVDDDGAGFDPASAERNGPAMGLFTMRERATLANGTFEIASTPQHGTSVRVHIPVGSAAAGASRLQRSSPPTGDAINAR